MKAIVLGTRWGQVHVDALQRHGVHVQAVWGRDAAEVAEVARRFSLPLGLTDLDAAQALAPDLVCIATPPSTHAAMAQRFAGSAILCEKPLMGLSVSQAGLDAFPRQRCWVNYAFTFLPVAQQLMDWLVEHPAAVQQVEVETAHDLGRIYEPAEALMDLAVHPLSLLVHLWGAPRCEGLSVAADGSATWPLWFADLRVLVVVRHAPGLRGLSHRIVLHTRHGELRLQGAFQHGHPWRFDALTVPGMAAMPAADLAGDPWMQANVDAMGCVLQVLEGSLSPAEGLRRGLFDVDKAAALDRLLLPQGHEDP